MGKLSDYAKEHRTEAEKIRDKELETLRATIRRHKDGEKILKAIREHGAAYLQSGEIRSLRQEIHSLKLRLRGRLSGEEIIKTAVLEVFAEPADMTLPKAPRAFGKGSQAEIPVLHFSDGQIGKRTVSYDSAVAEKRVMLAVEKTAVITELRRKHAKIPKLILILGGDEVEGEQIFPGQAHRIDSGVFEQAVKIAPAIYAKAIRYLLGVFREIEVFEVPGNHGKAASKNIGSHPKTNWDNVCHYTVRVMLAEQKRVVWHPNEDWYQTFKTFGDGHLVVHGDQINGGFAGMPWYGVSRKALAWAESVKEWTGARRYLWHGHFHQLTSWPVGNIRILGNGSPESHNEYARREIGLVGQPEQRLAFFGDRGLLVDQPLYLGEDEGRG